MAPPSFIAFREAHKLWISCFIFLLPFSPFNKTIDNLSYESL